jgi:hypothetical protein
MPPPYPEITAPMRAQQIEEALLDLETSFPALCTRTTFPGQTFQSRQHSYVKIASASGVRPAVLLIGGVHGREWAPPDALVSLARNLLVGFSSGSGITFPAMTVRPLGEPPVAYKAWTIDKATVQKILTAVDLYILPLVNPDGREYDLTHLSSPGWRKNRSPQAGGQIGVDLNRNFNIIWRFEDYYDVPLYKLRYLNTTPASTDPPEDTYRGSVAHSEQETKNVESLLDGLPIHYFADVHMSGRKLLYSWGLEENGSDPAMTFQASALDRKRDGLITGDPLLPPGRTDYKEFLPDAAPNRVTSRAKAIADLMHDGILRAVNGGKLPVSSSPQQAHSEYQVGQSAFLYLPDLGPNSGCSDDYACSRQFLLANREPIFAYTLETGSDEEGGFHCDYDPAAGHFRKINREIHGALVALLMTAATSPLPKPAGGGPCLVATATMGDPAHPDVVFLRALRDERLRSTARGARIAELLDRVYYSFSPAVAQYLRAHPKARAAVRRGLVRPLTAVLRALTRGWR